MTKQLHRASGLYTDHGLAGRVKSDIIIENAFRELKEAGYTKKQSTILLMDSIHNPMDTSYQVIRAHAANQEIIDAVEHHKIDQA